MKGVEYRKALINQLIKDELESCERLVNSSVFEDYFLVVKSADKEHNITNEFMIINPSQQYVSRLNKDNH
jgi:hypothetical protein